MPAPDEARLRCAQGHLSAPWARFCETCGQPLAQGQEGPAPQAAAPLRLDYTSGPFADFIAAGQAGGEPAARPARLEIAGQGGSRDSHLDGVGGAAPAGLSAGGRWAARAGDGDTTAAMGDRPPAGTGPQAAVATAEPGLRAPRSGRKRLLVGVLGLAMIGAGGAAGALFTAQLSPTHSQAAPSRRPAGTPLAGGDGQATGTRAATPSPSAPGGRPSPGSPAQRPEWTAPVAIGPLRGSGAAATGISCPRPGVCYLVDSAGQILASTVPGRWRLATTDAAAGLRAISCATAQSCLALDSAGNALIMNRGGYASPVLVDSRVGVFTAISCPLPGFCMATDTGGNAFAYQAGGWQPFTVSGGGAALTGISCTGTSYCLAVDTAGYAYTYNGSSWSGGTLVDAGHSLAGVSCASPEFCMAIDHAGDAVVLSAGQWKVTVIGITAAAVACPASGFCLAAGASGKAAAYRAGAWSSPSGVDGSATIAALSCPAVNACVAADQAGNALAYQRPAAPG